MQQSTSAFSALIDIFVDPKKAIKGLDANPSWFWLPLILLILSSTAMVVYYFLTIDVGWAFDQQMLQASAVGFDMPEEAMAEARNSATGSGMAMQSGLSVGFGLMITFFATALYFNLVNKFSVNDTRGYKNWLALVVFANAPGLLAVIVAAAYYIVAGDNQMSLGEMQFFSANSLFTHYPVDHSGASFMDSITPFTFWSIGLLTLGLMTWTKRSLVKSLLIAAAPSMLYFGIVGYFAFG